MKVILAMWFSAFAAQPHETAECPVSEQVNGHENVEWSISYSYHKTDEQSALPRVLLVGDSICNGYQVETRKLLEGKMTVTYWVSSYCVTSPVFRNLLAMHLAEERYDVVHFNNGLHPLNALNTPLEAYAEGLRQAFGMIRERQPGARIVWTTSTPLREAVRTEKVKRYNAAAAKVVAELGDIDTDDLFATMDPIGRDEGWRDMYHFKPHVQAIQAKQVSEACLRALAKKSSHVLDVSPGGLTPAEAVRRIRALRRTGDRDRVTVRMAKGAYPLTDPLTLTPDESNVVWEGEDGAVFSGGRTIGPWKPRDGVFVASIPDALRFSQLFVNGRRAVRARYPDSGFLGLEVASQVRSPDGELTTHVTLADRKAVCGLDGLGADELRAAELLVVAKWSVGRYAIRSSADGALAVRAKPWPSYKRWDECGARVALENVRFGFDSPGEWFLDVRAGEVLYRPLPGETAESLVAVAPCDGSRLVQVTGTADRPVEDIVFRNISFECAGGPAEYDMTQAASGCDGAVEMSYARNVRFETCRFAHTGNHGLRGRDGCVSNVVSHCAFEDCGAGGIWLGSDKPHVAEGEALSRREIVRLSPRSTAFNCIEDCLFDGIGRHVSEGTAVCLTHCSDSKVLHNEIRNVAYSGISVGWTWGYSGSVAQRNEIAYNRLDRIGDGVMSDLAGIYLLGTSFGTRVHHNVVRNVRAGTYGGSGLYADEGCEGVVFECNLTWNTADAGMYQHFGTGCVARNNIFGPSRRNGALRLKPVTKEGIAPSFDFCRNLCYNPAGCFVAKGSDEVAGVRSRNLFFGPEDDCGFDGKAFDEWQSAGHGRGNVFADPKFADAAVGDVTLAKDSPALALGFVEFDWKAAGRRSRDR